MGKGDEDPATSVPLGSHLAGGTALLPGKRHHDDDSNTQWNPSVFDKLPCPAHENTS